jgi:CHAD domain-containing protein
VPTSTTLGRDAVSRKARQVELTADLSASRAFTVIVAECTDHWRTNEAQLLTSRAMPHLHQTRVGVRRLRSAFSLFGPVLDPMPGARDVARRLRTLALPFGAARDLDVLLDGPLTDDLEESEVTALAQARESAYDDVLAILRSKEWADAGAAVDELVAAAPWSGDDVPVQDLAGRALDKRWRRVVSGGRRLHDLRAAKRHRVRIEAKKLRYGCEFFASLYAVGEPRAVTSDGEVLTGPLAYAWHVEDVQSTLGILNDQATANGLLASVGAEVPPVDEKALVDAGVEACAHLSSLPRFWR